MNTISKIIISIFCIIGINFHSQAQGNLYNGNYYNLIFEYDLEPGFYYSYSDNYKPAKITANFSKDFVIHEKTDSMGEKYYIDTLFRKKGVLKKLFLCRGVKYFEQICNFFNQEENIEITYDTIGNVLKYSQNNFDNIKSQFHDYLKTNFSSFYINSIFSKLSIDSVYENNVWLKIKLATDGTVFERYANGQIKIISNYTDILQRKALRVNIGKDGILDFIEYF